VTSTRKAMALAVWLSSNSRMEHRIFLASQRNEQNRSWLRFLPQMPSFSCFSGPAKSASIRALIHVQHCQTIQWRRSCGATRTHAVLYLLRTSLWHCIWMPEQGGFRWRQGIGLACMHASMHESTASLHLHAIDDD
jgi:hypothetical protein